MLFRSTDGGERWQSLCDAAHSPSAANFHGLMPDPEAEDGVIVGTDNGEIWRARSESAWIKVTDGLPAVLALAAV